MTFDELRDAFPDLGFALYAIEPRGIVTLEVHEDGRVFPFIGATAQEAIDTAFPSTGAYTQEMTDMFTEQQFNIEQQQPTESVFD